MTLKVLGRLKNDGLDHVVRERYGVFVGFDGRRCFVLTNTPRGDNFYTSQLAELP